MAPWLCLELVQILVPHMNEEHNSIPAFYKVLSTIRFLAEGSYQKGCGNDLNSPMSQPSVSRAIHEVVPIINEQMHADYIQFPNTPEKRQIISQQLVQL